MVTVSQLGLVFVDYIWGSGNPTILPSLVTSIFLIWHYSIDNKRGLPSEHCFHLPYKLSSLITCQENANDVYSFKG